MVAGTVIFGQLQARVQTLAADYEAKRLEMEKAVAESDELRQMQEGFREQVFVRSVSISEAELTHAPRSKMQRSRSTSSRSVSSFGKAISCGSGRSGRSSEASWRRSRPRRRRG